MSIQQSVLGGKVVYRIYTLQDEKSSVFYVGCTTQPLKVRLKGHKKDAKVVMSRPVCTRIRKIGLDKITITIIEEHENRLDACFSEGFWICQFAAWGFSLENKQNSRPVLRRCETAFRGDNKQGVANRKRVIDNTGRIFESVADFRRFYGLRGSAGTKELRNGYSPSKYNGAKFMESTDPEIPKTYTLTVEGIVGIIDEFGDFYHVYKNIDPPKSLCTIAREFVNQKFNPTV